MSEKEFNIQETDEEMTISLMGRINMHNVGILRKDLFNAIDSSSKSVILNLRKTRYIDSSGIGFLLQMHQKLVESGRELTFTGLNEDITRTFRVSGLLDVLKIS